MQGEVRVRLTKAAVLEQVKIIRQRVYDLTGMTTGELRAEYKAAFPAFTPDEGNLSRELMIRSLLVAATYYTTLVLDLE